MNIEQLRVSSDHEAVYVGSDPGAGYHGVIAIHSTRLGPAVGGTRLWKYPSLDDAVTDALRLSRGMTFKNAVAGLPLGGGKSVILRPDGELDRDSIFRAHGRFVAGLEGRYRTAEDVGTTPADMEIIRQETPYVAGLASLSGDPSPFTAHGVFRAIEAACLFRFGSRSVAGRSVAIQGVGNVGFQLARELAEAGASLVVSDVNPGRVARLAEEYGARPAEPRRVHAEPVDIFAPCALGGTLNAESIPQLKCSIVAGAANNQLLTAPDGERLRERSILYVPDYVANAGGVINGSREMLGWTEARSRERIEAIYDTTLRVLEISEREGISPALAADRLALACLSDGPVREVSAGT